MYVEGEEKIIRKYVKAIICDCCKTEYADDIECQEFLHFWNKGGYGSVFGDGAVVRIDVCQHCIKKMLGEFIHNEEDGDG